jgi:tetratricopeptide (TPR) repeat protein
MLGTLGRLVRRPSKRGLLVLTLFLVLGAGGSGYAYALYQWNAARAGVEEGRAAEVQGGLSFCLSVWPRSPEVHLLAARAARSNGDFTAAEAHLKQCIRLEGGASPATQLEFLLMRVQSGEEDEVAPKLFQLVDAKHPQSQVILETVARAFMYRLRYGPAYACLTRWIQEMPNSAKPYHWRGWVLERLDNHKEAMKDYLSALERDPDLVPVRLRVAAMLLEDNQPQQALPHLQRLRAQFPDRADILARLGQCRLLQGQGDEARQLLEVAVAKMPDDIATLLALGKLELQEDRPAKAEGWLRRAMKADPADSEVQFNLASSLQLQGRKEEAEAMLDSCEKQKAALKRANDLLNTEARHPSKNPVPPTEVGSLLLEMGQERLGLYWLEQALMRNPNYEPAHRALAQYFDKKGDARKAAAHRARLSSASP